MTDRNPKTLLVLYPGCIFFEVALAVELINERMPVVTAGPDGADRIDCAGVAVAPDLCYGEAEVDDYGAVVVPGGDPGSVMRDASLDDLLRAANHRGLLLAGICAGALVLAKAGVLSGRRITHTYTVDHGPREIVQATERFFAGTEYVDEPLVADGNVITAKPEAYVEFAVAIAEQTGVLDAPRAGMLRRYYRGRL